MLNRKTCARILTIHAYTSQPIPERGAYDSFRTTQHRGCAAQAPPPGPDRPLGRRRVQLCFCCCHLAGRQAAGQHCPAARSGRGLVLLETAGADLDHVGHRLGLLSGPAAHDLGPHLVCAEEQSALHDRPAQGQPLGAGRERLLYLPALRADPHLVRRSGAGREHLQLAGLGDPLAGLGPVDGEQPARHVWRQEAADQAGDHPLRAEIPRLHLRVGNDLHLLVPSDGQHQRPPGRLPVHVPADAARQPFLHPYPCEPVVDGSAGSSA